MIGDCFPVGESINLLFNSDIVNLLLKDNGVEAESLILLFCCLECLNYQWVDVYDMWGKVLLGLDENAYLVFSAFENMSPGNG